VKTNSKGRPKSLNPQKYQKLLQNRNKKFQKSDITFFFCCCKCERMTENKKNQKNYKNDYRKLNQFCMPKTQVV